MMDIDNDVPPLLESSETSLPIHQSFHESSTNVSVADSAAATIGSESFREFSDRGQISSNSSSDNEVSDDDDSFVESASNSNKPSTHKRLNDSNASSDDDWIEEPQADDLMNNFKYEFLTLFCLNQFKFCCFSILDVCFVLKIFPMLICCWNIVRMCTILT